MPTDSENRIQQHTRGPWQWSVAEDSPCADIRAGDTTVAYVLWGHGYFDGQRLPPIEQAEANARLIAAAPELLAALKDVVAIADRKTVEFDRARAAIALAEGRSQ